MVLVRFIQDGSVIGDRYPVFAIGENIASTRIFLRPQAVNIRGIGDLDDLVTFHDVTAYAGNPGISLVIDPQIAAIIGAISERHMGVVSVSVQPDATVLIQVFFGLWQQPLCQNLATFVGLAPAGGAAAVEYRDTHHFAHRRQAHNAYLTGLAATPEAVVIIEIAGANCALCARCSHGLRAGKAGGCQATGGGAQACYRSQACAAGQ